MKKFLLAVALVAGFACANAEEVDYAPKAGSFSTEVSFNPLSDNGNFFSNGGKLSAAYFVSDKLAVTLDFGLSGTNTKNVAKDPQDGKDLGYTKEYNGKFTLGLGVKYYFYNYKRINLYGGANISYNHDFAGTKNYTYATDNTQEYWDWTNAGTGNGFGIHAITGIDFHIYKGLFLGIEISAGFDDTVYCNTTNKVSIAGNVTETKNYAGGHNFTGGFNVTPMFRLGWAF